MRSLTEAPNVALPAPSPKMRISAPVPRNLQSSEFLLPSVRLCERRFCLVQPCAAIIMVRM